MRWLKATGARVLRNGEPKIGEYGLPVMVLDPKDFAADELDEVSA